MTNLIKKNILLLLALINFYYCSAQHKTIDQRVDSVFKLMTLDEKIGQMNQYNGDWDATGPIDRKSHV